MVMLFVTLGAKAVKTTGPASALLQEYLTRLGRYVPCTHLAFLTEDRLFAHLDRKGTVGRTVLVFADSRGALLTSTELADKLGTLRDSGAQTIVVAVGPADGWTAAARSRADILLSFGRMTLPHELAGIVLAEQAYRSMTILAGHPYHSGH